MGLHFLYVAVYKHRDCAPSRTVIVLDEGKGIIRVDGLVRNNAGVAIGNATVVRKIKAVPAEKLKALVYL
jgi:transitional endoplasmic reticulum ATPase